MTIRAAKVRPGMTRVIWDGNCVVDSVERHITTGSDVVDIRFVDGSTSSSETMAPWVRVPVRARWCCNAITDDHPYPCTADDPHPDIAGCGLSPVPTGEGTGN